MEKLLQLLNGIAPLSPALVDHLKRIAKRNSYKKRSYLLQEGQVSKYIHYVESGLFRCFYDNDVKEINIWFMPAGNIIISVESFFCQADSYQYIQALEDCITWSITYQELHDIYRKYPEFLWHRGILLEKYYMESERRQRILSISSAEERYLQFLKLQPDIILRLPAKYVASYLNIGEAYFSRIRSRYSS